MTRSSKKWTLFDTDRDCRWGGEFDSDEQARRWRDNAELPSFIQPMTTTEVAVRLAKQVNDILPP